MNKFWFFIFIMLFQVTAQTQPTTKQVLVAGNGTPIVLLHGGTFDHHAYAPHAKILSAQYTVIAVQQFNVQFADEGRTLPANYSVTMESDAVGTTLDSLNIAEPVVLVGHSYGGVIVFDFAMRHPQRVRSLVLAEAPLFYLAKLNGVFSEQMAQIEELTKGFTPQANITETMIKDFRCKMTNCDSIDIYQHPMWPKWVARKNRLRGLSVVPAYSFDTARFHAFRKPVLIVTGTNTIDANKIIDSLLSKTLRNATKAALPGDHIAIYQNPEIFVQLLQRFLQVNGKNQL